MLIKMTANCGVLADWAKENGYWHDWTETPRPGDLALFDWSGGHTARSHVGICRGGGITIEGNTGYGNDSNGGAVMLRQRSTAHVTGYIRPPWSGDQSAARLLEIAEGEIGTKESPAGSNYVKYNTWYYGRSVSGDAYPWCCVFVCWCFAVLAGETAGESGSVTVQTQAKRLARGSRGSAVRKLQLLLNGLEYSCGSVDGDFGARTDAAVRKYQGDNGLEADGIVGAATWRTLLS